MTSRYDVLVVGAGIVGLASALRLLERHPGLRLAIVDKESAIGRHQTGHNSGVVHRGVYYTPGSLKARLCVQGAAELTAYCVTAGIPVREAGKVIVALDASELPALEELHRRATANGVPDLELIGPERLRELEPHAAGVRALYSPRTSVVDFGAVAQAYADDVARRGGELLLGQEVRAIHDGSHGVTVETRSTTHAAAQLIACAGLQSDLVAAMSEPTAGRDLRIIPFRGDYYMLRPERRDLVRGLIYPVPDPRFPFLGVHFTIRHDGEVWAGPNAVIAFRREGYEPLGRLGPRARRDARLPRVLAGGRAPLAHRGRRDVARLLRRAFVAALRRYVPEVRGEDLVPGPSGVRAQAVARDGGLVDDSS